MLHAVKNSLEELQLSSCGDINDNGVKSLACLSNLKHLHLFDLPEVRDRAHCITVLQSAIPCCEIEFPYAKAEELKPNND